MSKKLSLQDRYYISMYSRRLQSTLKLRFAIDAFLQQIEFTREETEKYEIGVDPTTFEFRCNDSNYVVDYNEFPIDVVNAIKHYISLYDHEENKDNVLLHKTLEYLKKVI